MSESDSSKPFWDIEENPPRGWYLTEEAYNARFPNRFRPLRRVNKKIDILKARRRDLLKQVSEDPFNWFRLARLEIINEYIRILRAQAKEIREALGDFN